MKRDEALALLRAHERDLRAAGIESVSIFGSVARGETTRDSDLDLVVQVGTAFREGGFAYFGRLDALNARLSDILGCPVDILTEPVLKDHLRREIARDSALAF
jgi:hypothetical protein